MKKYYITFLLKYLALLAKISLSLNKPQQIIGIAGSVGKSSTRNAVKAFLQGKGRAIAIGNSETGIPLGILGLTPIGYRSIDWIRYALRAPLGILFLKNTKYLIVEMGIDDPYPPKNMSYLLGVIKPTTGVLVSESAAHTEQFEKSLSKKQKDELSDKEKVRMLTQKIADEDVKMIDTVKCETVIYNDDNSFIKKALNKKELKNKKIIGVGVGSNNAVSYTTYSLEDNQTTFGFKTENGLLHLTYPALLPEEYREVLGLSLAVYASLHDLKDIKESEAFLQDSLNKHYTIPKGRAGTLRGIKNTVIIDSSYNASKIAMLSFLSMLEVLKKQTKRPIAVLFGDMRELGEEAEVEHKEVALKIREVCDYVYLVGELTEKFVLPHLNEADTEKVRWFASNRQAGEYLAENIPENAIILVKGSQNTIFLEESIKYFLADTRDAKLLCRQEEYWLDIKRQQNLLGAEKRR